RLAVRGSRGWADSGDGRLVGAAQLGVVPAGDAGGMKANGNPLTGLRLEHRAPLALDRLEALGVADGELLGEREDLVEIAMDLGLRLDREPAQLVVLVAGLD